MIDPLPAVALDVSKVLPPVHNEAVPLMFAVGEALTVTLKTFDVYEQPLLLLTLTVYDPAAVAE